MLKNTLCLLALLVSFSAYTAEKYVMVVFHGLGGFESRTLRNESIISAGLKKVGVEKFYNAGHDVSKKQFGEILNKFDCQAKGPEMGLIIVGYSWGARAAYEFSKTYEKKCGKKADYGYLIDGIQKPVFQFKKAPIADVCKNYYKTISPIRGRAVDNCENTDLTESCKLENGTFQEGMPCHQTVLGKGFKLAMEDIQSI